MLYPSIGRQWQQQECNAWHWDSPKKKTKRNKLKITSNVVSQKIEKQSVLAEKPSAPALNATQIRSRQKQILSDHGRHPRASASRKKKPERDSNSGVGTATLSSLSLIESQGIASSPYHLVQRVGFVPCSVRQLRTPWPQRLSPPHSVSFSLSLPLSLSHFHTHVQADKSATLECYSCLQSLGTDQSSIVTCIVGTVLRLWSYAPVFSKQSTRKLCHSSQPFSDNSVDGFPQMVRRCIATHNRPTSTLCTD